jgi:hypothetical protein
MTKLKLNHYHCSLEIKNGIASILDHLTGFDIDYRSLVLEQIIDIARDKNINQIVTDNILDDKIQLRYPDIHFSFNLSNVGGYVGGRMHKRYTQHPPINYNNFICSFNGSDHVSRKLLVAILERFGYFTTDYCSKNFVFTKDKLGGHITDYVGDQDNFYCKFFIADDSDVFFNKINSFGHVRYDHKQNIYNLESKLTESFLHVVSETMATSYYPFVTEKFLYSVVTRGLFLAYAQPGWHEHLEKYHGFKRYTKLFDYRFDSIQNPVDRLVELITMISKFGVLSTSDWRDLYLLQQDEIEYNYNHYFSGDYLKHLKQYA